MNRFKLSDGQQRVQTIADSLVQLLMAQPRAWSLQAIAVTDGNGVRLMLTTQVREHTLMSRVLLKPSASKGTIYHKFEQAADNLLRLVEGFRIEAISKGDNA